jgi:hypothetical protein
MQKYSDDFHAKDDIKRLIRLAEILFQKGRLSGSDGDDGVGGQRNAGAYGAGR